ncbi:MAG: hypothetical protein FH756_13325 [Firmicutes bacterium]|nr:hypothetical protein [Bacillota bacterium]
MKIETLKNGDSVGGGLVIRDINYRKGDDKAIFTLAGNIVLDDGELYYDDMNQDFMFNAIKAPGVSTIMIEYPDNFTAEYNVGELLWFRNKDAALQGISKSDLAEMKQGQQKNLKIRIKDIEFTSAYQSGWGNSCEFVSIEN